MSKTLRANALNLYMLVLCLYMGIAFFIALKHLLPTFFVFLTMLPVLFLIPGFAILQIFSGNDKLRTSSEIIFSIILSIFYLIISGLFMNTILPVIGIKDPLTTNNIAATLFAANILLILLARRKLKNRDIGHFTATIVSALKYLRHHRLMLLGPIGTGVVFLGTNLLNNGGSNVLIFVAFLLLLPFVINGWRSDKRLVHVWTLYWCGLAFLLILSLRSNYISGFDVSREFQLFNKTLANNIWQLDQNRDPYSACLSITIFPTIIARITGISPTYVYKIVAQLIFALSPVIVYLLANQFFSKKISFLGAFFFISQPWFIDPMVTLIRQEIGFVFFAGALLALYDSSVQTRLRLTLFVTFMIGVILSHYSSAYVSILVFIGLLIMNKIINGQLMMRGLNIAIVITLLLLTFLWNAQLTSSNRNLLIVMKTTIKSIPNTLDISSRSGIVSQVLNLGSSSNERINISEQGNYRREAVREVQPKLAFYENKTTELPLTPAPVGKNNPIRQPWYGFASNTYKALLGITIISMAAGAIILIYRAKRKRDSEISLYLPLALVGMILTGAMIILPSISTSYNFDRLYMQMLIFIAPVPIFGFVFLLSKLPKMEKHAFLICLLIVGLITTYTRGIVWQFVGGKADVWLNNNGTSYTLTYTHAGEHYSAVWVRDKAEHGRLVFADSVGRNILTSTTNEEVSNHIFPGTFPQMVGKYSYVYFTYAYTNENIGLYDYRGTQVGYHYPKAFLESNKNTVYDNKTSVIYL